MRSSCDLDSDEEAENGNPTTGLFSRSTNMRTPFTSSSHLLPEVDPQIPDDSKSSHINDDSGGIVLLDSSMPTPENKDSDLNVIDMKEKHNHPSSSLRSPIQGKEQGLKKRATGGQKNLTKRSISKSFAESYIERTRRLKVMTCEAVAAKTTEEDLHIGGQWTLLRIPPLPLLNVTSGPRSSLQGSQVMVSFLYFTSCSTGPCNITSIYKDFC